MQRNCEVTVLRKLMNKYQERFDICDEQWHTDIQELQQCQDSERQDWLNNDLTSLNAQMSAYECIIKDLRGIVE